MLKIYLKLPKELKNIINEYNVGHKPIFSKVMNELERNVIYHIQGEADSEDEYCAEYEKGDVGYDSGCEICDCFKHIKEVDYECYERHINCLKI